MAASEDAVDRIVAQWREQRPDLDPSAKQITGRIVRLGDLFRRRMADAFAEFELTGPQYGVLAALRRAGEPYTLTPTELARTQMMTSGGMTPVIDGLEARGLVSRPPNPADRRGRLVALTAEGLARIDRAMEAHVEVEAELVAGLSARDRDGLVDLLRRLDLAVEGG